MKHLARLALTATAACVLAAIWLPSWQMAVTAVVLLIAGSALAGNGAQRPSVPHQSDANPENGYESTRPDSEPSEDAYSAAHPDRPQYGRKADR